MAHNLDSTYTPPRSNRYTSPQDTNTPLPIVYGDLTDNTTGLWQLPCIDTVNRVYCYAAHETLTVANGNTITIYEDNVTVNPANYTFSASNNYESQGTISTITFSVAPSENAVISARGKGKPVISGSSSLMENVVDIIIDFLTVESGVLLVTDFNNAAKILAHNTFTSQGYKAAGVINQDENHWSILYKMASSFKGEIYLNADNEVILTIDINAIPPYPSEILQKGDIEFIGARLLRENIINTLPSIYQFNYITGEFMGYADGSAYTDISSVNIYGERSPEETYQFHFTRDSSTVGAIQNLIISSQKTQAKVWEVEMQDNTLKRAHIEVGDYIVATFDLLYGADRDILRNEIFKVLELNVDLNGGIIKLRCLDTGSYLTTAFLLDGSKILDGSWVLGGTKDTTVY